MKDRACLGRTPNAGMGFQQLSLPAATNAVPVFPRLGMLWSSAAGEGAKADKWARYGTIVTSPGYLGFEWEKMPFKNEAEPFQPARWPIPI